MKGANCGTADNELSQYEQHVEKDENNGNKSVS
jgi:hypothetical protein